MHATPLRFPSHGLHCEGELFRPPDHDGRRLPTVILGHGYGAERTFGTNSFIRAFVDLGCAVFAFDYRHFGGSEGRPRQLIDPARRCEDWQAALAFVRQLDIVHPNRLALWGTSYGGGHVLSVAAREPDLRAVIAQVPHCDARAAARGTPPSKMLRAVGHGLWDLALSVFGREHAVRLVGNREGPFAVLDAPGWAEHYLKLAEHSPTWRNAIPARSLLRGTRYSPVDTADRIRCPVLIVSGARDQGVPPDSVARTAKRIPDCRYREYAMDHFECYDGGPLNAEAVADQCRFLQATLLA